MIPTFAVNSAVNVENRGNGASMKRGLEPDEGTCRGVEGSNLSTGTYPTSQNVSGHKRRGLRRIFIVDPSAQM